MDKTKKQQDIEDYNHASKGVNNGRNHGFATPEHLKPPHEKSDQRDADIDIAYSILMEQEARRRAEFERRLRDLSDRYAAMDEASWRALLEAQENLRNIQGRANRSKDGRRIYLNAEDGQIYDEEGNIVSRDNVDLENWDSSGPTYSEFKDAAAEHDKAKANRDRVDEIGKRLEGQLTSEELDELEEELEVMEGSFPPSGPSATSDMQKGSLSSGDQSNADDLYQEALFKEAPQVASAFVQARDNNPLSSTFDREKTSTTPDLTHSPS